MARNRNISNLKVRERRTERAEIKAIKDERRKAEKESLQNINLVIGMDNGCTGTICSWILKNNDIDFRLTPSKHVLNYQKEINYLDRLDHEEIQKWIKNQINNAKLLYNDEIRIIIILERPMVNPQRFDSSLNAVRSFEALLVILQQLNLKYITIDSKQWQHHFFGKDTSFMNLKLESLKIGIDLLRQYKPKNYTKMIEMTRSHGDADALLITKYAIEKLIK